MHIIKKNVSFVTMLYLKCNILENWDFLFVYYTFYNYVFFILHFFYLLHNIYSCHKYICKF